MMLLLSYGANTKAALPGLHVIAVLYTSECNGDSYYLLITFYYTMLDFLFCSPTVHPSHLCAILTWWRLEEEPGYRYRRITEDIGVTWKGDTVSTSQVDSCAGRGMNNLW